MTSPTRSRLPDSPRRFRFLPLSRHGYPVPATTSRDDRDADFSVLSERRKLALATFDWCGVCGLAFRDETRWVPGSELRGTQPTSATSGEVPLHELCLLYAVQAYPFLLSPNARLHDEYRAGQVRLRSTALGYRRTSDVLVRPSEIQSDTHTVQFVLSEPAGTWSWATGSELADHYLEELSAERDIDLSSAEETLVRLFNDWGDTPDPVTGAAVLAGAAFLSGVRRLSGVESITTDIYGSTAAILLEPSSWDLGSDPSDKDPATSAVVDYLLHDDLGQALTRWRAEGRRRAFAGTGRNDPCPCGSGRKFKHCHG